MERREALVEEREARWSGDKPFVLWWRERRVVALVVVVAIMMKLFHSSD